MISYKKFKIGDLVSIRRGASPRPINDWISSSGVPWVKISDATEFDSKYIYKTNEFIREEGKNKSVEVFENDLIISNSATPALPKIMKIHACVHDGWLIPYDYKGITKDYLYYAIKYYRKYLLNQGNGSIFKNLKTDILKDFEILVPVSASGEPNLYYQNKIIEPLKKIDDLIEENLLIIKRNNEMMKYVYNYYFDNYDKYCDNLVFNEKLKKDIPSSWNVMKIDDVITHINTGLNPRDNFKFNPTGGIKYITVKNLTEHGYLDLTTYDIIDDESRKIVHARSDIREDDILFASIAPLGRCYIILNEPKNWDINESVFSIRVNNRIICPEYLYMFLKSEEFIKKSENMATGSIFSGIRINSLLDMDVIVPGKKIMEEFKTIIRPLLLLNESKARNIEDLKNMRDKLLPLLMNGQIKMED